MRLGRVLACVAATAWTTGNALLIALAPRLFAHAPTTAHPDGAHDFVSHEAAGAVFGDALALWSSLVTGIVLPVLVLGVALAFFAALKQRRTCIATLWLVAVLAAAGLHAWSASALASASDLLADLRSGRAEGARWSDFHALHRQSRAAMGAESIAALVLALAAAASLARREASAPGADA